MGVCGTPQIFPPRLHMAGMRRQFYGDIFLQNAGMFQAQILATRFTRMDSAMMEGGYVFAGYVSDMAGMI